MDTPTSAATNEELQDVQPTVGSGRMSMVKCLEKDEQGGVTVRVLRIGTDPRIQVLRYLGDIAITRSDHDVIGGAAVLRSEHGEVVRTINPRNCVTSMLGLCEVAWYESANESVGSVEWELSVWVGLAIGGGMESFVGWKMS